MRAKDIMLLVTTTVPLIILVGKFWNLPTMVEAQAKQIEVLESRSITNDKEIAVLKAGITDIKDILNRKLV